MNCPNCGKSRDKVIDSRLAKDGITIRRRRQCLACSERFTTHEAIEEQLLPFLILKNTKKGSTVTNLKARLSFMSKTLKILSKETENLTEKIEKLEKVKAAEEAKKRARERKIAKQKAKSLMMTETVLKIIRRHRKGVNVSKLKEKTGFDNKKIYFITSKLKQQGKIKSGGLSIYIKA
jgi:transcriptional repressor NrdR